MVYCDIYVRGLEEYMMMKWNSFQETNIRARREVRCSQRDGKRYCSAIFALLLILSVFTGAWMPGSARAEAAKENDPVAVRVGDVSYPLSLVQFSVDPYVDIAEAADEELTEEDKQNILQETVERFIGIGVIENKLREAGKNDFTEDEMDILRAEAARQYEQTWQQIYRDARNYANDITEQEITAWMTQKGYTQDAFLRELMASERESRILDLYCADVTMTDEDVQRYYREQFLEPDREKYQSDVPRYEEEVMVGGLNAFYIPEGYRYIKNFLLAYPEEVENELAAIQMKGRKVVSAAQKAYNKLAEAAAAGEELTELKAAYDKKLEAVNALEQQYREKEKDALPLLADTIASIREQLAAGISIETLLAEYSLDQQQTGTDKPGALYHADSTLWPREAHEVIDAVTQIGGLSEPYCDQLGVHLIYYAGDAPGGERALSLDEQMQLKQSALYYYQLEKLNELIDGWRSDYDIFTDFSGIHFDE